MKVIYGIKAYGKIHTFNSARAFRKYLLAWIDGTEGSERDRAATALANLENGVAFTDTDQRR